MSDNLKSLQIKLRGDFGSGKTEFLTLIERMAKRFGMQTRMDGDGHNLSITSTKEERDRLYEFNREELGTSSAAPSGPITTGDQGPEGASCK